VLAPLERKEIGLQVGVCYKSWTKWRGRHLKAKLVAKGYIEIYGLDYILQ